MGQITIDTGKIINFFVAILAIIGLIAIIVFGVATIFSSSPSVVATPQVTSQATTISYPSVLTFTVLSTTTSTGRYQVLTTSGNILYFSDYETWNRMRPQGAYTATLVGMEGSAYLVGEVTTISAPYDYYNTNYYGYNNYGYNYNNYYDNQPYYRDYPTYWYYGGRYYQCDKTYCDQLNSKQIKGETVYNGRPPRPLRDGGSYYY
jgi:hypothetical protein